MLSRRAAQRFVAHVLDAAAAACHEYVAHDAFVIHRKRRRIYEETKLAAAVPVELDEARAHRIRRQRHLLLRCGGGCAILALPFALLGRPSAAAGNQQQRQQESQVRSAVSAARTSGDTSLCARYSA